MSGVKYMIHPIHIQYQVLYLLFTSSSCFLAANSLACEDPDIKSQSISKKQGGLPMKTACSFNLTLCVLQMFVGITAILGGIGLVSDPSGAKMEVPLTLLENSTFANYLIPGLVLLIVIGVGNVLGGIVTFFRQKRFGSTAVFLGGFLVLYILIEIGIIGLVNFSQPLYFILGVAEVALGIKLSRLVKTDSNIWVERNAF